MAKCKNQKRKTLSKRQPRLSARQVKLIDELFESGLDEASVLSRHGVSTTLFRRWLGEAAFADELQFRIDSAERQSRLIIARYAPVAAAKLVSLTDTSSTSSQSQETARKACLDIISLPFANEDNRGKPALEQGAGPDTHEQLSPQLASRLLAALAKEEKTKTNA
jgi:hypothetical protein